jgi:hypothetical protein
MGLVAKAKAFQRPPLATTWPYMALHNHNWQNGELAFWLFCSTFLA